MRNKITENSLMNMRKYLAKNETLRKILLPIIKHINFELRFKHNITKRNLYLLSFLHKGYWYYGSQREEHEINRFKELINIGDNVLEIGAHIGYVTQVFEELVGEKGAVIAVEPTPFNLRFLYKNISPNTKVMQLAASEIEGKMDFYTEKFGGFTNSLISEFTEENNKFHIASQKQKSSDIQKIEVDVSTIDLICKNNVKSIVFKG